MLSTKVHFSRETATCTNQSTAVNNPTNTRCGIPPVIPSLTGGRGAAGWVAPGVGLQYHASSALLMLAPPLRPRRAP